MKISYSKEDGENFAVRYYLKGTRAHKGGLRRSQIRTINTGCVPAGLGSRLGR